MRYRIGETPGEEGFAADLWVFNGMAVFSFLLGIGFVLAGIRSKHYWLSVWGAGLSLCSVIYLVYIVIRT